jgi:sporulation-control protein
VFKKMLAAFGVGGPSVDTVLDTPTARPGGFIDGQVHIRGGDQEAQIDNVLLSLVTRVEIEGGDYDHEAGIELNRFSAGSNLRVAAGQAVSLPFRLPVPWETPITSVYGQHLHGMVMGVRTELVVAAGRDKSDLDAVAIAPLPVHQAILDAFAELGFRYKHADVEHGRIHGVRQELPIYQEIEFWPSPRYGGRVNEVELTFVTNPHGVEVVLEFDKRAGLFGGSNDVFSRFSIGHDQVGQANWTAVVDGWVREATERYQSHLPPGYGHGHGHGHRGPGMGTVLAAGAAGVAGGVVAGEVFEEVFEDDGGFFE